MKPDILIIDDDMDICVLLQKYLAKRGFNVNTTYSATRALEKFKEKKYDIIFCDYRLGDKDGKEVLLQVKELHAETEVVIMTAYSDIKTAVNLIKSGAFDYITKPLIPDELLNIINKAMDRRRNGNKKTPSPGLAANTTKPASGNEFLEGESHAIKELYHQVNIVAPTDYSIILYGESGSGKEVIAKTIHERSTRKNGPFVALDCGTLSKELANSELFGHMKGSFTGAISDKKGHFELANGGTLFLDEVANLSYVIQAALLRVLQERKMKRIGGTSEMHVDVRIIVASHENLRKAYQKGDFREDLFHRLNEFSVAVPPLRERKEDIPLFAAYFLEKTNEEVGKQIKGFDHEVMEIFSNYSWPGNLREFRNVMRKAVLLTSSGKIDKQSLPPELMNPSLSHSSLKTLELAEDNDNHDPAITDLKDVSAEIEYQTIIEVLKAVNFNKTKAAKILKIDRKTLYNKIKGHDN